MIIKKFISGPLGTNSILLACSLSKKAAIVDPAEGKEEILTYCDQHGLHIEKILLTHGHFDHVGDVFYIKEKTGAEVYIHKEDALGLENPLTNFFSSQKEIRRVKPDHFLQDNEKIFVGKILIEVLYTPGHTMGSVCFYIEEANLLLSGDTLFKGAMGKMVSSQDMAVSLKRLSLLPPGTRVIPGHGSETSIGKKSWLNRPEEFFF
jgi:hydroxyacylglutathione hydrolase